MVLFFIGNTLKSARILNSTRSEPLLLSLPRSPSPAQHDLDFSSHVRHKHLGKKSLEYDRRTYREISQIVGTNNTMIGADITMMMKR